jgi:hypothetical protein
VQKINVAMAAVGTMGHYSIYVALLQTPIEGPGFADADPSLPGPSTNGAGAIHGPGQNYNGHLVSPVHGTVSGPQARQVAAQGAGLFNCIR